MRYLIVLILIAAGVGALGFERGWFHVAADSTGGTSNVTLTVDNNKVQEDKDKVVAEAKRLENKAESSTTQPASRP